MSDNATLVRALFTPRAVALIGASADPTKNSGRPQRFLKAHGYTGDVYPINPGRDEVQGVPAFKSVTDVSGPVDHAFVMVPAKHVEDAIRDCGAKGVPVATIYSDGFAETGDEGRKMQERLVATARKAGVRLIGPNSMGVIHPASSLTLSVNAVLEMEGIKPGGLSLISQSGTILGTLLSRGAARQQGAQNGAALGNERQAARLDPFHLQHRVDGKRQRGRRMNDTHGIGADQAHAGLARRGDQAFLHLAAFVARFGEAVGIDGGDRHALGAAVADGVLNMLGRDHDEGMVDRARNVGHGLERGHALNLVPARVDGIDVAGIAVGFEKPLRPAGVFRGVRRGADQGHGPGREQGPDQGRVVAHLALVISLLGDAARTGCRTPPRRCGS